MWKLPDYRRILLLTEGCLGVFTSKTAASLLRYRAADCVGVVDSVAAARELRAAIPWAPQIPIFGDLAATRASQPDALFVGIAPVGGALPPAMRRHLLDALRAGIDVVSGLHTRIAEDAELAATARDAGAKILDIRTPLGPPRIATGAARKTRCRRVLTIGTDCNVGKMVTALELTAELQRRGRRVSFAATGQTGIMIAGRGIAVDAVVADFVAGAAEELILAASENDYCVVEGQGSIAHPGYSGVTQALIHGTCPEAFILVHHLGRANHLAEPHVPIPPLARLVEHYEQTAALLHPARVLGIAVNAHGLSAEAAARERAKLQQAFTLPIVDPLMEGCVPLVDALERWVAHSPGAAR